MKKRDRKRKKSNQTAPFDGNQQLNPNFDDQLLSSINASSFDWALDTRRMPKPMVAWSFSRDLQWTVDGFLKLPAYASGRQRRPQRIVLVCLDVPGATIGLEIWGDVLVGRSGGEYEPDFDLSIYGEKDFGISREHATLRWTANGVEIQDMKSTNGTRKNGTLVEPAKAERLNDKDIIAFGSLQFQVRVVPAAN